MVQETKEPMKVDLDPPSPAMRVGPLDIGGSSFGEPLRRSPRKKHQDKVSST